MVLPFKGLFIFTQDFGANPQDYLQFGIKAHDGLDFGTPHRTELIAPHAGSIIEAASDPNGYGLYIKIESEKEGSVIAHMDAIDVKVGYQLRERDHIGWSDNTGNSTGPHCHWGYYKIPRDRNNGEAGFIDPKPYLEAVGIHLTLGQLPVIDTVQVPVGTEGTSYKGLDLTNTDSVKAAIDAWYDVANGKYVSADEYHTLDVKLAEVKKQLTDIQIADALMSSDLKNYHEMQVLGYTTIDDVSKVLKTKDDTNLALQQENSKVRQRNSTLATMVQEMEDEDHTASELGEKALSENKRLKEFIQSIAKVLSVEKLTTQNILDKILHFKDLAEKFLVHIQTVEDNRKVEEIAKNAPEPQQSNVEKLFEMLNLQGKVVN